MVNTRMHMEMFNTESYYSQSTGSASLTKLHKTYILIVTFVHLYIFNPAACVLEGKYL